MNSEIKLCSPIPTKILKPFVFNSSILLPKDKKKSQDPSNREDVEEILKMRGNSQNPHEKDENFKCQSSESFGEMEQDWEKLEENFYELCK